MKTDWHDSDLGQVVEDYKKKKYFIVTQIYSCHETAHPSWLNNILVNQTPKVDKKNSFIEFKKSSKSNFSVQRIFSNSTDEWLVL